MTEPSLAGVWAKLDRGQEHRESLKVHIDETFAIEANRPRLAARFDPETRSNVLFVSYIPDLGDTFVRASLLIGDAAHNLRSALDHLVYQLALRYTLGRKLKFKPRETQFPITKSEKGWQDARNKYLRQVPAPEQRIIERYQGYSRIDEEVSVGDYFHPLVMLGDLDNEDKHRLLTTVMLPARGPKSSGGTSRVAVGIRLGDMVSDIITPTEYRTPRVRHEPEAPIEVGLVISRSRLLRPLQREVDIGESLIPTIALTDGRPVVEVLDKIALTVAKVIREFDPFP